jgi:phycocyanin-associated rod protein
VSRIVSDRKSNSANSSRYFRYEVTGLHQNESTTQQDYAIRSSATIFITVPFHRMSKELRRISRLGGKVVSIQALTVDATASANG